MYIAEPADFGDVHAFVSVDHVYFTIPQHKQPLWDLVLGYD